MKGSIFNLDLQAIFLSIPGGVFAGRVPVIFSILQLDYNLL